MNTKRHFSILMLTVFTLAAYTQTYISETIQYDGETREYEIYVPAIYDGTEAVPLIFSFHGGGGDIAGNIAVNDMSPIADTANFLVVYPQALPDPNDKGSTNWIHKEPTDVDDVFFIDALIYALSAEYQIDQSRIYACGYSLGGEFSYEVACRLNNRIAAIGAVARTMGVYQFDSCSPVHPTGILTILGTEDPISLYEGVWWQGEQFYLSAAEMHEYWAQENNCEPTANVVDVPNTNTNDGSTVERHTWSTADGCAYVEELKVIGGDHDWPGYFGNMDIDATMEIWQFVSRYDINGLIGCEATSVYENGSMNGTITAYPNPVKDILKIEIELNSITDFTIYSMNGEIVLRGQLNSDENTINISELAPNIYTLHIENQVIRLMKSEY